MNKQLAINKMSESLETYCKETNALFEKGSCVPATKGDVEELSRQVFFVLEDFKSAIETL